MFDPEKVERWEWDGAGGMMPRWTGDPDVYVKASDYDKLLALYRELQNRPYSTWPKGG